MATGIILAGGASSRMPGDKAFLRLEGRPVIEIQLEQMEGLFDEVLVVANTERIDKLSQLLGDKARVVEEPVRGKGPLGGILSGLMVSSSEENFILACDMPFVKRAAIAFIMEQLDGYDVAVPDTPAGLEPLHAAYKERCAMTIEEQLAGGDLKVTDFYDKVLANYVPWREMADFDPSGRLMLNVNSPDDLIKLAGQE